jgi:ABC-type phosphate transport system auxiliary subunit
MTKIIGLKIQVEGGGQANAEVKNLTSTLERLRLEIQKQTDERRKLNKALKDGSLSQREFAKRMAATETRLKGLRSQYSRSQKSLLQMNGTMQKTGGLTAA